MNGFAELRELGVVFRPFDGPLPPRGGRFSPFTASWTQTINLLADELRHLDAKRIAVELALTEGDLRMDGMPRANARLSSPAVRINFDSRWGPLRYETAEYDDTHWKRQLGWQANVRAIALSMEALRKVDRYGVSKRGEQYRGWRALPMSTGDPADKIVTREDALGILAQVLNLDSSEEIGTAYYARRAQRRTHPDLGGDPDEFRKVMKAVEVLGL